MYKVVDNVVKRNFNYSVGDTEYSLDGTRLVCKVAGTTGTDPLRIPSEATEVIDGTVTWKLMNYAEIDYSLDEKKIGTWVDGKPLYQKTYSITGPSTMDAPLAIELPSAVNATNVIDIQAILYTPSPYNSAVPMSYFSATDMGFTVYAQGTTRSIQVIIRSNNYASCPVYITIQYTKTTD